MEAIGPEVFLALLPIAAVLIYLVYKLKTKLGEIYIYIFGDEQAAPVPENRDPIFEDRQCSICLGEPKIFEVSSTCGHSFCCACLFEIYDRTYEKIACPLCRKPITTMFKAFDHNSLPAETRFLMENKIREYNSRFDDNRPLIRRIMEFPYVLMRMRRHLSNPRFWILFIRSLQFFRVVIIGIFYFLLPFDLIPERIFGIIGFFDDFFMFLTLLCIGLALFAPLFIRAHQP